MIAMRAFGALLLILSLLPLYELLGPQTGLAGAATRELAAAYAALALAGTLLVLLPGIVTARLGMPRRLLQGARTSILRPSTLPYALLLGVIAAAAAGAFSTVVLHRQPNLIDAMAQLQHARYFADGQLAAPAADWGAFWHIQQTVITQNGWVSQYPPMHSAMLALGLLAGAAWLVGPLLLGTAGVAVTLIAERLLPNEPLLARTAALLTALSPFLIAHAGAYMSHTTAAAFGALAIYFALRAVQSLPWSLACGAALGALFGTRPLTAVAAGIPVVVITWIFAEQRDARAIVRRVAAIAAGAAPLIALIALYNAHFFGSPFTFGYTAAQGPSGDLGFGVDPWGNRYGIVEAIAYTSAELTALGVALLESPLPIVPLIGLFLLLLPRLERATIVLLAWAAAPALLHVAYWHHGIFMGPRMLNETAPAWILLATVAAFRIVQRLPHSARVLPAYSPRALAAGALLAAFVVGPLVFGPLRLAAYRTPPLPHVAPADTPALVFVHGGWTSRLAMRLASAGMRLDSVETALRQNSTCAVQQYANARAAGRSAELDFAPRAVELPPQMLISPGNRVRVTPGEQWSADCAREANADRNGVLDVSRLLWHGDLPGLSGAGVMYARDMGPELNEQLLRTFPERTPFLLLIPAPDAEPVLTAYEPGIAALWTHTVELAGSSGR